jgi:hypothetical protein
MDEAMWQDDEEESGGDDSEETPEDIGEGNDGPDDV